MAAHFSTRLLLLVPWLVLMGVCAGVAIGIRVRSWKVLGLVVLVLLLSIPVSVIIVVLSK